MNALQHFEKNFLAVYEEPEHVASLGRGAHYSIVRYIDPLKKAGSKSLTGRMRDLAIIFDEDHDTRIFEFIGKMHEQGLLEHVLFIGERKASVTILLDDKAWEGAYESALPQKVVTLDGDEFQVRTHAWNTDVRDIINDREDKVLCYLSCIKMLWNLGVQV